MANKCCPFISCSFCGCSHQKATHSMAILFYSLPFPLPYPALCFASFRLFSLGRTMNVNINGLLVSWAG